MTTKTLWKLYYKKLATKTMTRKWLKHFDQIFVRLPRKHKV